MNNIRSKIKRTKKAYRLFKQYNWMKSLCYRVRIIRAFFAHDNHTLIVTLAKIIAASTYQSHLKHHMVPPFFVSECYSYFFDTPSRIHRDMSTDKMYACHFLIEYISRI